MPRKEHSRRDFLNIIYSIFPLSFTLLILGLKCCYSSHPNIHLVQCLFVFWSFPWTPFDRNSLSFCKSLHAHLPWCSSGSDLTMLLSVLCMMETSVHFILLLTKQCLEKLNPFARLNWLKPFDLSFFKVTNSPGGFESQITPNSQSFSSIILTTRLSI